MNNNILIYGNTGFIGSNLKNHLDENFTVQGSSLRSLDNLSYIHENDIIINLVGKAHDHGGVASESEFNFVNLEIVQLIYKDFIESNAKVLIHISSIAAVEENNSIEVLTEESLCRPESLYGSSKRAAEEFLLSQDLPKDKKVIILRPTMVHGQGDKGNLTLLYKIISKGVPYPLAAFDNKRSFLSIDNFSFFIEEIIKNIDIIDSGIYHICDDEPVSTSEIVSIISKVSGRKVRSLPLPKSLIIFFAKIGDYLPIPLNSKRLGKMTNDLLVSNCKIKKVLDIRKLPIDAVGGLESTIRSFKK
ncbi:NAD-dependent epimerase/dehydratase family protein [Myroides sp. LJL115]